MSGVARADGRGDPAGTGEAGDIARADGRGHTLIPHTADTGLRVVAPSIATLFEETAAALLALTADAGPDVRASVHEQVRLEARDLPGLAYLWLNELVALGDIHHAAVVEAAVERLGGPDHPGRPEHPDRPEHRTPTTTEPMWRLHARIGLAPFGPGGPRPRRQVKSATYHRLDVRRGSRGWMLLAYLDV